MRTRDRRRAVALLLFVPTAVWVAIMVVRIGMADALAPSDPAAALGWWAAHHNAQSTLARQALDDTAAREHAERAARSILGQRPLDGDAYAVLAEAHEQDGDAATAAKLYAIGSQHAPRDRRMHAWLADHYAAQGDYALMLGQIDELMRMMVRGHGVFFPAIGALVVDAKARAILVRFLGARPPPWREEFLRWYAAQPNAPDAVAALFAPLRSADAPLTEAERSVWIDRLARDGNAGQAYALWVEGLPAERRVRIGNVYDGGFEFPADAGGFGWRFSRAAGASIRQEAVPGAADTQALLVEFYDQRVPFEHVQQLLALPAGRYQFSGTVQLDDLRNERGLIWQLRCSGGSDLAATAPVSGSSPWRAFSVDFEIPAAACASQILKLKLDARIKAEQMIGGRVWFDDLRIVRRD